MECGWGARHCRIGAGCQNDQAMIRALKLLVPSPNFQRADWDASPVANDLINHDSVMEPPIKIPKWWGSRSFWVGEHIEMLSDVPEEGMGAPPLCPYLALCVSSIGLFLSCILNHNPAIVRKGLF